MKIGSLFTGTGALDMAARAVFGGEVVWHSDIKPAAVSLLEHRHSDIPNIGDLTRLFPAIGPVPREALDLAAEILLGGWPCQPHSSAGKRLGEDDPRALWPNVRRAIAELRPRLFLGENVARVTSNGELRRVVRSLAEIGYVGSWRCITAEEVGAPHKRDRLFLLAVRADAAADTLGQLVRDEPGRGGWPGGAGAGIAGDHGAERALRLLKTPTANLGSNGGTQHPDKRKAGGHGPTLAGEVEWLLPQPGKLLPTPAVADARNTRNATAGRTPENDRHHSGWTLSDVAFADRWGIYTDAVARWAPIVGRPAPEPVMPSPKRGGRPILAPAFVEWMMGLPAGWVTGVPGLTRAQQLSMLGDGVVPLQAEAAYRALLSELTGERAA